jgi:DNA modification methylase
MIAILQASAFAIPLADSSVQMVVTSPPYYGLRNYAANPDNAFGREATVGEYVQHAVEVLREIHRVLRQDGVVFWNIADSYREKNLCLIPQRIAIAAQDDGWIVRDQIIWHKPAPMPESAKDRCTRSYEPILMLTKSAHYFWDTEAVAEKTNDLKTKPRRFRKGDASVTLRHDEGNHYQPRATRNPRNVWTLSPTPFRGAHFATFPQDLPRRCILAASKPGDTVLDPFGGSGTTGVVAEELGRHAVLLDISREYVELMQKRMADVSGLPVKPVSKVVIFRAQEYEGSTPTGGGLTPPGMHMMVE